jgi:hypothetical protein
MTKNDNKVDPDTRRVVMARDKWTCQLCGRVNDRRYPGDAPSHQDEPVTLEIHHKVPVSQGGSDDESNLITLCQRDHNSHHHDPAPPLADDDTDVNPAVAEQATGLSDPESKEAKIYVTVARHGPVRTGQVADSVDLSGEHARRLLYSLGARDLVVPTRDGGWDIRERVVDPPVSELPDTPSVAAIRTRDELLRRAADWGLGEGDLAEIADVSPRTVRVAVDRAATYDVPLPDDNGQLPISDTSDEQTTLRPDDDIDGGIEAS